MEEQTKNQDYPPAKWHKHKGYHKGGGSALYFVGFIGALVYYIQHAATFGMGLLGLLKSLVWPAMVVYKLLEFLKM